LFLRLVLLGTLTREVDIVGTEGKWPNKIEKCMVLEFSLGAS
jgi:hypothetical protein